MTVRPGLRAALREVLRPLLRDRETDWRFSIAVCIPYLAFLIWMHAHHELWRDEMHSWTLSRLAHGFGDLVWAERRYEGHPPLWFWYLHVWSWFVDRAWGLQAATVAAALAAAALFLRYAPFPRALKVALLFSYYLGFEYTVLSRNYVLGWLCICVFCAAYHPLRSRTWALAAALSLLALTSVYGLIMAVCLLVFLGLDAVHVSMTPRTAVPRTMRLSVSNRELAVLLAAAAAIVFCAATLEPVDPNPFAVAWNWPALNLKAVPEMLSRPVAAFLPIRPLKLHFWFEALYVWERHPDQLPYIGAGLMIFALLALRRSWRLMIAYALAVLMMAVVQQARISGSIRHWGHFFLFFLAVAWLLRTAVPRFRHLPSLLLLAGVLPFQIQSLAVATAVDTGAPFSGAREAAAFIRRAGLQDLPFVGGSGIVLSVAGYTNSLIITPETEEVYGTVVFHSRRRPFSPHELLDKAIAVSRERKTAVLVVVCNGPLPPIPPNVTAPLLFHNGKESVMPEENFYVYRLQAR